MNNHWTYVDRAAPGLGWVRSALLGRRSGAARWCRRTTLCAGIATWLWVPQAIAQTAEDVFACATPGVSVEQLRSHFSNQSWDAEKPDFSDILKQLIFLGNVDAESPSTWNEIAKWANDLSKEADDRKRYIYALGDSAVAVMMSGENSVACMFVSNRQLHIEFQRAFPRLRLNRFGERQYGWLDPSDIRVGVAVLDPAATELVELAEGRLTTASILNKTTSTKED